MKQIDKYKFKYSILYIKKTTLSALLG